MRIRFEPFSVGTSIVPPWRASVIVIGTVTSRLPSSACLKTGDGATRVVPHRAPARAPGGPAAGACVPFAGGWGAGAAPTPGGDVPFVAFARGGRAGPAAGRAG